jgi:hypothetical protein
MDGRSEQGGVTGRNTGRASCNAPHQLTVGANGFARLAMRGDESRQRHGEEERRRQMRKDDAHMQD